MAFLLLNKPAGLTSHDVVDRVRRITGEKRVGHAGTLDPFATGLLIVGVGRESTKHLSLFLGMDKTYTATFCIGKDSTTLDPEGEITTEPATTIDLATLQTAIRSLTGPLEQIPPMHSAIKIGGKKLYELARKGIEIDRPARPVTIHEFNLVSTPSNFDQKGTQTPFSIQATISCSSGTYIRSLARDLGEKLGTKAYLTLLERSAIGPRSLSEATNLSALTPETWEGVAKNLLP